MVVDRNHTGSHKINNAVGQVCLYFTVIFPYYCILIHTHSLDPIGQADEQETGCRRNRRRTAWSRNCHRLRAVWDGMCHLYGVGRCEKTGA